MVSVAGLGYSVCFSQKFFAIKLFNLLFKSACGLCVICIKQIAFHCFCILLMHWGNGKEVSDVLITF